MFADIYSNYTGFSFAINGVRDKRHLYGKTYLAFMKNTDEKKQKKLCVFNVDQRVFMEGVIGKAKR